MTCLSDEDVLTISSAILKRAAQDYLSLFRYRYPDFTGKHPKLTWKKRAKMMADIEDFFLSSWGQTLSLYQSEEILERLKSGEIICM